MEGNVFFLKWRGPWPAIGKIKTWCDEKWGKVKYFKTLENGFCMVLVEMAQDRDWILNGGPYFLEGFGFYMKA